MAEKTEKPTDKRRKDSAKKGQTFKSKDLTTTCCLLTGIYFITHYLNFREFVSLYTIALLHNADISISSFLAELTRVFLLITFPLIAVFSFTGIAMTLLQTRFSIATEAIKLNVKALNPVEGVKKIFSMRTVKEFVKSICYLIIFAVAVYLLIYNDLRLALSVVNADVAQLITIWLSLAFNAVLTFIGCSIIILIADFMVEYFLHFKDLKMDKHEVKRERKENDGNPEIKGARKRIHHEILSGEEMSAIRSSEVVMANPTHIAIAIYFNPDVASLPFIAFRATNQKARAAIAYAKKMGIPVIQDRPLARRIYKTYRQYSFISLNDEVLMTVMNILIWLRQVEVAGMSELLADEEGTDETPLSHENNLNQPMMDKSTG